MGEGAYLHCRDTEAKHQERPEPNFKESKMQPGMIGLGRMGGNIVRRLMKHGHTTVVYDKDPKAVAALAADGAAGSGALEDFVSKLEKPPTAWVMLPAGKITEATIDALSK